MTRYDTTFILNPQIGDDAIEKSVKSVAEVITTNKGEILRENRIGSRRLAYIIARQTHGYYVSFIYDGNDELLKKLDHHFRFGEDYMRSLTVLWEGDPNQENMSDVMLRASRRHDSDDSDSRRPSRSHGDSRPDRAPATAATATATTPAPAHATTTTTTTPAPAPAATETAKTQAPAPKPSPAEESPKAETGESTSEEDTL